MIVRVYDFLTEEKPKFADNLVGIVNDVLMFKYTRRAYDIGSFELQIPVNAQDAETIVPDRMLIVGDNVAYSYIVGTTQKTVRGNVLYVTGVEKTDEYINVSGYDLKYLFALRVTLFPKTEQDTGTYGYYVTNGSTFHCIVDLVNYNIVQATDTERQIYGMGPVTMKVDQIDAGLTGIKDDRYMTRLEPLSTAIFNLLKNCKTHLYEMRLIIDDDKNKPDGYNPFVESGEDEEVAVISDDKYNIRSYSKTDDTSAYKNAIYAVAGTTDDSSAVVKLVKRSGDTAKDVARKEVVVDVDSDSVENIDSYALKAAEEYTISDDFEITPIFHEDVENGPKLAQKTVIKIDNATYETIITEITDEYTPQEHKVTYTTGNKKLKVLNVLNRSIAGNTQKIVNQKIDGGQKINNPVILAQNAASYMNYSYKVVGYNGGDKITYPDPSEISSIIIQGYVAARSTASYSECARYGTVSFPGDKDSNKTNIEVSFDVISTTDYGDYTLYKFIGTTSYVNADGEIIINKQEQPSSGYPSSRSNDCFVTPKWESIHPPSDSYPYGYAFLRVWAYYYKKTEFEEKWVTGYNSQFSIPFASIAEYNAAVKLTRVPIEMKDVTQTASKVVEADGTANFPEVGETDMLYIDSSDNCVYKYSTKIKSYYCVGRDYYKIKTICSVPNPETTEAETLQATVVFDTRSGAEWSADRFIPPKGYMCITIDSDGSCGIKIGDGVTYWTDLKYLNSSYAALADKPKINGVELIGDKSLEELGLDLSGYLQSDELSDWAKAEDKPTYTAAEIGAAEVQHTHSTADISDFPDIPTKVSELQNDSGYLTSETDPTVPAWAKAKTKPTYTAAEVGAAPKSHTHTKSQITDFPTAMKNPSALTVQMNGTTAAEYDGGTAKTVNITPSGIGAAAVNHTHNQTDIVGRWVRQYGSINIATAGTGTVTFTKPDNLNRCKVTAYPYNTVGNIAMRNFVLPQATEQNVQLLDVNSTQLTLNVYTDGTFSLTASGSTVTFLYELEFYNIG